MKKFLSWIVSGSLRSRALQACLLTLIATGSLGAACGKKDPSDPNYQELGQVLENQDQKGKGETAPKAADPKVAAAPTEPVTGANLAELSDDDKKRFAQLAEVLQSPCGKAHSLRVSRNTDTTCVRAKFAVDYLVLLLTAGANDDQVKETYNARYINSKVVDLKVDPALPHVGNPATAKVVIVEFFDFGCPMCKVTHPELDALAKEYGNDLVIYYRQYPLPAHPDSKGAAQAALAAAKQGKYLEMHALLFEKQGEQKRDQLNAYAKSLGLNMTKFAADYSAVESQVEADRAEGNRVGVQGTPSIFINGRVYEAATVAKVMKMWIDEELAVLKSK